MLVLPEMSGVGYPVLGRAVAGGHGIAFLVALLVGKLLACSLTIGIGGSGGVFAPSLFCGAFTGAEFGDICHAVIPGAGGSMGAYAMVGNGCRILRDLARAPITAVVILFELTGEYTIILLLILAIALATGISHVVSTVTVYTRKLLRRGTTSTTPGCAVDPSATSCPHHPPPSERTRTCDRSQPTSSPPATAHNWWPTPTGMTSAPYPRTTSWTPLPPEKDTTVAALTVATTPLQPQSFAAGRGAAAYCLECF